MRLMFMINSNYTNFKENPFTEFGDTVFGKLKETSDAIDDHKATIDKMLVDIEDIENNVIEQHEKQIALYEVIEHMVEMVKLHNKHLLNLKEFVDSSRRIQDSDSELHELHNKRLTSNSSMIFFVAAMNILCVMYYSGDLGTIIDGIIKMVN